MKNEFLLNGGFKVAIQLKRQSIKVSIIKYKHSSYLPLAGMECLDYTYQSFLDMLGNPDWDSDGVGFRQWIYQTCTEFGWYQSSDQPDHPYGTKFPLEFSIKVNNS